MQHRTQSVLVEVCLALACALGAGFSGDMRARTVGHGSQHARHTRGTPHRTARASSRDTHGDHAHEIEQRQEARHAAASQGSSQVAAESVSAGRDAAQFHKVELLSVPQAGFVRAPHTRQQPPRAPPALA